MSDALTWAALSIATVLISKTADSAFGQFVLGTAACFLLAAGLFSAPWARLFG